MAQKITYYVALPFMMTDIGLAAGEASVCPSESTAIFKAEAFALANVGAVAFSRACDPDLGTFEDAVILRTFGEVPRDIKVE